MEGSRFCNDKLVGSQIVSGECIVEALIFNETAARNLSQPARDSNNGYMLQIQGDMSSYCSLLYQLS